MKTQTICRVADLLETQLKEAAENAVIAYQRLKTAESADAELLPLWKKEWERAAAQLEEARVTYVDYVKQDWEGSSYMTESNVTGHAAVKDAARIIQEAKERCAQETQAEEFPL